MATTGNPRCCAPMAISTMTGRMRRGNHFASCLPNEIRADSFHVAFVIFQVKRARRPLLPRCWRDWKRVRPKPRSEASLAWRHFFAQHSRMAVAKKKDQAALRDAVDAQLSRLLDDVGLGLLELLKQGHGSIEVLRCCLGTFVGRRAGGGALLHGIFSFAGQVRRAHAHVRLLAQSRIAHDAYNAQSR